ncbi:MFS transporter [Streptomyces ipomoeae]|uniref:MFS transporter n=1 Tax=Streptomyces ipomoeae TaxID=103232 RepID=A0AAE8W523_9ACTN|nr:MFS transporter [Streptomyces ipomoeae]MDX2819568.1 MFS transporter [Streptomyces ipomoeae]MDX2878194.1 MFS transporter [Streptomyces ipomoeae]TQE32566.1 MFS transporter [Streptomyces ipomoeae]TQE37191.1 MFS transporter [Streptomyces ipomoeae]
MLAVLRHRAYRHLFAAQVIALVGTGLATVALGLLAYDLAGADAGSVLGTALAIKMVAYVAMAPAVGAVADRLPRRALMVSADLIRAGVAVFLPFVDQIWQVYVLVFLLQSASAAFTPTFQAVIPDVLPEEREYTRALSLSRLAYDLESLFSPALAAALLSVMTYSRLFTGTVFGFLASAALVATTVLPERAARVAPCAGRRTRVGSRVFLAVPQLRSLLALNLAVAAAGAMVTVNSVVYVRDVLGLSEGAVPLALGAYGAGSMVVALVLPRVLDKVPDRAVMLPGALSLVVVFAGSGVVTAASGGSWRLPVLLGLWAAFGAACSAVLTPTGRLIRRSVEPGERTAAFAAQFSLSHGCWLLTYPLAGWLGAAAGLDWAVLALGSIALAAALLAVRLWPSRPVPHVHADLPLGHPHLVGALRVPTGWRHSHGPPADGLHARS